MASILRACASAHKRFSCEDFSNLGRTLTYFTRNSCGFEKFPAVYNVRCLSTREHRETAAVRTEIYYGNLTRQIRALKLFSLLTSVGSIAAQPFLYSKAAESGNAVAVMGIFAFIGFIAVTTPLLLHIITKKYVTYVYYNAQEDKYIANTYSLFVRRKELEFTPKDVIVPDITGIFTNVIIKDTPLFLDQRFFHEKSHFIRMMGYDKPIDFKLSNSNDLGHAITGDTEYKDDTSKK